MITNDNTEIYFPSNYNDIGDEVIVTVSTSRSDIWKKLAYNGYEFTLYENMTETIRLAGNLYKDVYHPNMT